MLVPAFWEALMLGCDDEALGFCLEAAFGHLWVLSLSTPAGQQGDSGASLRLLTIRVWGTPSKAFSRSRSGSMSGWFAEISLSV